MIQHNENPPAPTEDAISGASAPIVTPRDKEPRETAAGCRERATDDLTRALAMDTANGRTIFERSAASWTKRADMLHRLETGVEARLASQKSPDELT